MPEVFWGIDPWDESSCFQGGPEHRHIHTGASTSIHIQYSQRFLHSILTHPTPTLYPRDKFGMSHNKNKNVQYVSVTVHKNSTMSVAEVLKRCKEVIDLIEDGKLFQSGVLDLKVWRDKEIQCECESECLREYNDLCGMKYCFKQEG